MASTTDWARAVATTITNYLKQEEIATLRRYRVWSMIESGGNVLTNQSGRGFTWEIQFRQQPVSGNDGETRDNFHVTTSGKQPPLIIVGIKALICFTPERCLRIAVNKP